MAGLTNDTRILAYIRAHPVAVLGTMSQNGNPYGAPVYVYATALHALYFMTKIKTKKYQNIVHNPKVSMTIVDPAQNSTLQAGGKAHIIKDPFEIEMVMAHMATLYAEGADWLPPISKLRAGPYQVLRITPHFIRLALYKGKHAGGDNIFYEHKP